MAKSQHYSKEKLEYQALYQAITRTSVVPDKGRHDVTLLWSFSMKYIIGFHIIGSYISRSIFDPQTLNFQLPTRKIRSIPTALLLTADNTCIFYVRTVLKWPTMKITIDQTRLSAAEKHLNMLMSRTLNLSGWHDMYYFWKPCFLVQSNSWTCQKH